MLDFAAFARRVRVTDGVYGTELQKAGLVAGACPERLNLDDPAAVETVARSYVQAGSDVIMTNSLGAHRFGLAPYGMADQAAMVARAAAEISRRAATGSTAKVFGSFGPSGKMLMLGEASEGELADAFAETAAALCAGGAEAIVLETFNDLEEARIALQAVKRVCRVPVIVSMAFAFGPDKTATMMGNTPGDLAAMAKEFGADAVGANCGVGPDVAVRIVQLLHQTCDLPVWIKPNAGLPEVRNGQTTFPMGPEEFASFVPALLAAGASFIGGCCGCGPAHIRAVRKALTMERLSEDRLELIDPTPALREAFIAMLEEFQAAENSRVVDYLQPAREDFDGLLRRVAEMAAGVSPPGNWPESMYWLVRGDGDLIGLGYLRPDLPEHKQRNLGHVGYYVRPSQRNKGCGTAMMKLLMVKARQRGMRRAMVICRAGTASARVIQKNGGRLDSEYIRQADGARCQRYWVDLL